MSNRLPSEPSVLSRWRELCQRPFIQAAIAIRDVATVHKTLDQIGPDDRAKTASDNGAEPDRCGFALEHETGDAYNEEAFHYFLEIERRRSELSNRPFLLMLIEFTKQSVGSTTEIDAASTGRLFSVLSQCLRDTDFVGWYREGRIAGAVLTQHGEPERDDLSEVVRRRVDQALTRQFPPDRMRRLQVRVYQLSPHSTLQRD